MITYLVHLSFVEFEPDSENQFSEEVKLLRIFTTEDDALDVETAQARIYTKLKEEFTESYLIEYGYESGKDLKLIVSQEI